MNASRIHPSKPSATAHDHLRLREIAPQLRAMLADPDWLPACQDIPGLNALLTRIENDPEVGESATPPDVAVLLAAHQDFIRFRNALAARLNTPDDKPLRITPEEWLYLRLRHPGKGENLAPYANYRLQEGRFRIGD